MYRKPRFLKVLHAIREQMSREVDYDVDLFVEMIRATKHPSIDTVRVYRNRKRRAATADATAAAGDRGKSRRRAAK